MAYFRISKMDMAAGQSQKGNGKVMNAMGAHTTGQAVPVQAKTELLTIVAFLEEFGDELEGTVDLFAPGPFFRMALHVMRLPR